MSQQLDHVDTIAAKAFEGYVSWRRRTPGFAASASPAPADLPVARSAAPDPVPHSSPLAAAPLSARLSVFDRTLGTGVRGLRGVSHKCFQHPALNARLACHPSCVHCRQGNAVNPIYHLSGSKRLLVEARAIKIKNGTETVIAN
jgi:hypothetical protein